METPHEGGDILHEGDVRDVIDDQLVDTSNQGVIADLPAASASYVQAEATATRTALNSVLGVLRDAGLIPTP